MLLLRVHREQAIPDSLPRHYDDGPGDQHVLDHGKIRQEKCRLGDRESRGPAQDDHTRADMPAESKKVTEIRVRRDKHATRIERRRHNDLVRSAQQPQLLQMLGVMARVGEKGGDAR